jgi:hypothetical protein
VARLGLSLNKHALSPYVVVFVARLRCKVGLEVRAAAEDKALTVVCRQWPRSENIESDGAARHITSRVAQKHR